MPEQFPPAGFVLRVKDWDEHFERAQSRKVEGPLSWVAIPTRQDGLKFNRLMAKQNASSLFGVFILMLEIAARSTPRGTFRRAHGDLMTTRDLAEMSGLRPHVVENALKVLMSNEIGWIEMVEATQQLVSEWILESEETREEKRRGEEKESHARARGAPGPDPDSPSPPPAGISPGDFKVTAVMREWAEDIRPDVDLDFQTAQFLDWYSARGMNFTHPVKAWQKWIRDSKPGSGGNGKDRDEEHRRGGPGSGGKAQGGPVKKPTPAV